MKHPFWLPNNLLLILMVFVLFFIYYSQVTIPDRSSIEPRTEKLHNLEKKTQINIHKIYEHDLFGTYKKSPEVDDNVINITPLPAPPEPQEVMIPSLPEPQLLEPLQISLKGITVFKHDIQKNRAIIQLNKTNDENIYCIGDQIEDAHIMKIFSNKVILLRTNGQQEVLYLREEDAQNDPMYALIYGWENVIKQQDQDHYTINATQFANRITNLSQFIDALGITTAYKKGTSIGCKIGDLDKNNFGPHIGLLANDIIININDIPATDTQNRLSIYNHIINTKDQDTITIDILRNNRTKKLFYTLTHESVIQPPKSSTKKTTPPIHPANQQSPPLEQLSEDNFYSQNMNNLTKELHKKEKSHMIQKGIIIAQQDAPKKPLKGS